MAFIPTIWSKEIDAALRKNLVAQAICNTNWEGDIKNQGDTVNIFGAGSITVSNYTKKTEFVGGPEFPDNTTTALTISEAKMFNFAVDDIDKVQSNIAQLKVYTEEAAIAVKDVIDQFILSKYSDVAVGNTIAAATITSANVYAKFNEAAKLLTTSKVPLEGRWAVVSPAMVEVINAYLAGKNTSLGDAATTNGYLGKFAGFNIYLSHNVPNIVETNPTDQILLGHPKGITFAHQAAQVEAYRPEKLFADAVKGLHLYGAKVMKSGTGLVLLKAWY